MPEHPARMQTVAKRATRNEQYIDHSSAFWVYPVFEMNGDMKSNLAQFDTY